MSEVTTRTQEQRREEAIAKMIQSAVDLIAVRGVAALTMAEVGINAGYSRGLAHQHFGTKEKLLSDCMQYLAEQFNVRRYANHPSTQGLQGLYSLIDTYLIRPKEALKNAKALILIVLDASVPESSLSEAVAQYNEKNIAYIMAKLQEAKKSGEIRADLDESVAAFVLLSLLRGCSLQLLSAVKPNAKNVQKAVYDLVHSWLLHSRDRAAPTVESE